MQEMEVVGICIIVIALELYSRACGVLMLGVITNTAMYPGDASMLERLETSKLMHEMTGNSRTTRVHQNDAFCFSCASLRRRDLRCSPRPAPAWASRVSWLMTRTTTESRTASGVASSKATVKQQVDSIGKQSLVANDEGDD